MEGFGSPKNFGLAPLCQTPMVIRGPGASKGTAGDAKCVTEILGGSKEVGGQSLNLAS